MVTSTVARATDARRTRRLTDRLAAFRAGASRLWAFESIADTPNGFDPISQRSEFLAQPEDGIVDGAVAAEQIVGPDRFQQVGTAERASGTAHQQLQQVELGRRQIDGFAGKGDLAVGGI